MPWTDYFYRQCTIMLHALISSFSTLRIFHTPHFLHSSFSTLRIFYTPHFLHSSFSTLCIFHTPHFLHSIFSTLLIVHTPHSALLVFHLTGILKASGLTCCDWETRLTSKILLFRRSQWNLALVKRNRRTAFIRNYQILVCKKFS